MNVVYGLGAGLASGLLLWAWPVFFKAARRVPAEPPNRPDIGVIVMGPSARGRFRKDRRALLASRWLVHPAFLACLAVQIAFVVDWRMHRTLFDAWRWIWLAADIACLVLALVASAAKTTRESLEATVRLSANIVAERAEFLARMREATHGIVYERPEIPVTGWKPAPPPRMLN